MPDETVRVWPLKARSVADACQPITFMRVASTLVDGLITPGSELSRKASCPALGAQSPKSPLLPVVKLFQKLRLVTPPSIEKYDGLPVVGWIAPSLAQRSRPTTGEQAL